MPPTCGLTYRQKPFLWTRIHSKTQGLLKADCLLSSDWTRPSGQLNVFHFGGLLGFIDQFQLCSVELSNSTCVNAGQHWLERLPLQPKKNSEQTNSTKDENVLHFD